MPAAVCLPFLDPRHPLAFERVLAPCVLAARARLAALRRGTPALLAPAAIAALERALLARLCAVAAPTLISEFHLRRGLAGWLSFEPHGGTDALHRGFVAEMADGGFDEILRLYPELRRLTASLSSDWVERTAELLGRFEADRPFLCATFGVQGRDCHIAAILPDRSDPHDGGRAVAILVLGDGTRLVYKPRPIVMEAAFATLLRWANAQGVSEPFRTLPAVVRAGYGWIAHVDAAPCARRHEVVAYYRRAGGLLALLVLLQATDVHHENLVAAGDQPVLVDCETMLHPRPRSAPSDLSALLDATGMVPPASGPDFSGLGALGEVLTPFPASVVAGIGTDAIAIRSTRYVAPARVNGPMLGGRRQAASAHAGAVANGFATMLRLVSRERCTFLQALGAFAGQRGRLVIRGSNAYGLCIQASLQPQFMRDPSRRADLFAEAMRSGGAFHGEPRASVELAALQRLDVPRFDARCDQDGADWSAPLAEAVARVEALCDTEIAAMADTVRRRLAMGPRRPPPRANEPEERTPA